MGDDEEKDKLVRELNSKTQCLGLEHSETLEILHHLAFVLTGRGEYEEAEVLLKKAAPVVERVYGTDHSWTTHSLRCLAIVLREAGKLAEAENTFRQISKIQESSLGKAHPDTLHTTGYLAWVLYRQGKYEKILELYPDLKEEDSNTYYRLTRDTSRLDAAEIIYRGSLQLSTKFLGKEHPETLGSQGELAHWLKEKCRRAEAETMYRQLVTLRTKVLGKDHKDTLESMNDLAGVLGEQKKYQNAEEVLRELITLQQSSFGMGSLEELKTMGVLARVLLESGRLRDAKEILGQLVTLESQLSNEEHPETLKSLENLAIAVSEQEQYADAEKIFRQSIELLLKSVGKDNPKVLTTLSYLALMLEKQGNHDEAERVLYKQRKTAEEGLEKEDSEEAACEVEPFTYEPLASPKHTRILKIYPSRYEAAALVCELTEEALDNVNPPSYAAVSYTWGSQRPSRRIFCHGKTLLVTENCEAILRRFRQADKMSYLWVDAICINQSIVEERNDQVAMMEDIYRLAEIVVVWLGPATEITGEAFNYFESLAEHRRSLNDDRERLPLLSKEILEQPWFTRMWTIQEVAMASPNAVYLCRGNEMMRWESFMQALATGELDPGVSSLVNSAAQIFNRLRPLFESARASSRHPDLVSPQRLLRSFTPLREILNILIEVRGKLATDVRDKVFALHGIFKAFNARFPAPDYSKPAKQVFHETAKAIIEQDKSLHILYHVSSRARMPDLPSWVPDWGDTDVVGGNPSFSFWSATRGSVHRPSFDSENRNALRTSGKVIGEISTRSTALPVEISRPDNNIKVFQDWIQCCQHITDSYVTGDPIDEAFYGTLIQLPSTEGLDVFIPKSYYTEKLSPESYKEWVEVIKHGMGFNAAAQAASDTSSKESELASSATTATPALDGAAKIFNDTIQERLGGKALFLTDTQHIGTAGDVIQEGDVVTLLSGLEMPIILRPNEKGYSVVTWAYVHGVMEGEEWPVTDDLDVITLV
ncbi:heterokaryon incompatibility protein-domain-containing protein [Xylaria grammica]|nr:heterokaryon incompatibility protein-domain-containing protein [Xylaria grammica]